MKSKQKGEALVIICFIIAITGPLWMPWVPSSDDGRPTHIEQTIEEEE
jgi:hypothetical protein